MNNQNPIEPYNTLASNLVGAEWEYHLLERQLNKCAPNTDAYKKTLDKCKAAANTFTSACVQVKDQYDKEKPNLSQNIILLYHIMQDMFYRAFGTYL